MRSRRRGAGGNGDFGRAFFTFPPQPSGTGRRAGADGAATLCFSLPFEERAAQRTPAAGCSRLCAAAPDRDDGGAPPVRTAERMARAPACRVSIFAMVGSKLTLNARMPESVRVRGHLRWHGALPGSAPSPVSPDWSDGASAATTFSNRPRIVLEPSPKDPASFPEGSGRGPHRPRSPPARLGAIAGVAGLV